MDLYTLNSLALSDVLTMFPHYKEHSMIIIKRTLTETIGHSCLMASKTVSHLNL